MIGKQELDSPDRAMLAELRKLRAEIRGTRRLANRTAAATGRWGSDAYRAALVEVFDDWIATSSGQRQLVCFASAAEMGFLLERHVDCCRTTAMQSGREVLRVLYWTVMRRWAVPRRFRAGNAQMPKPAVASVGTRATPRPLCGQCHGLQQDPRRASGHPHLYPVSPVTRRHYSAHLEIMLCEHRCRTCDAQWMMSSSQANPFVGWVLRAYGAPAATPVRHCVEPARATI